MARRNGMEIRVDGLRELQRIMREVGDADLKKELRLSNKAAAEVVEAQAELEAPKGPTGRLARSVGVQASQRDAKVKAGSAARVPYAGVIHFGGRGIRANPFLYRAMAKKSDEARAVYEEKITALAERLDTTLGP